MWSLPMYDHLGEKGKGHVFFRRYAMHLLSPGASRGRRWKGLSRLFCLISALDTARR